MTSHRPRASFELSIVLPRQHPKCKSEFLKPFAVGVGAGRRRVHVVAAERRRESAQSVGLEQLWMVQIALKRETIWPARVVRETALATTHLWCVRQTESSVREARSAFVGKTAPVYTRASESTLCCPNPQVALSLEFEGGRESLVVRPHTPRTSAASFERRGRLCEHSSSVTRMRVTPRLRGTPQDTWGPTLFLEGETAFYDRRGRVAPALLTVSGDAWRAPCDLEFR